MAAFGEWTLGRQKALWRELADRALARWDIHADRVSWLGYGGNAVFRVRADRDERVLRICPAWTSSSDELHSEMAWLRHIRDETGLLAPCPIATKDGALLVELAHDDLPPPHGAFACLFGYLPGESKPASALTGDDLFQVGQYLARLHRDAQIEPPAGFVRPSLDAEGMFGAESPYARAHEDGLSVAQRAVCGSVEQAVRDCLARLAETPDSFGLIHADLLAKNILFHDGEVAALDFEFCAFGYFLYDLAPLLWQLKGERADDYDELESAMRAGYAAWRPTVEPYRDMLETFIAARQLASCRWLSQNRHHPQVRDIAPDLIASRIDELRAFLDTGELRRNTPTL